VSPRISVFLPSYNKGGFAVEAVRSVLEQDFDDYELWILENSTDDGRTRQLLRKFTDLDDPRVIYEEIDLPAEIRNKYYACPYLLNQYYPLANGEIILYVSDDDLFMPGLFKEVDSYFDSNPEHDAVYFSLARTTAYNPGEGKSWRERWAGIRADIPRTAGQVDCSIDGGQVAYRKHVLDAIGQPYFYDGKGPEANHADGLHMNDIGRAGFYFYPMDVQGVIHRHTPASVWTKSFT
jgi:glycosyltransferase involved in cell wall biosynthesis